MERRAFRVLKLPLGAYQTAKFIGADLGDQFTKSGDEPRTLVLELTTAMDEEFKNRTVTALLTEDAQRDLITVLETNLDNDYKRAAELITEYHAEYGGLQAMLPDTRSAEVKTIETLSDEDRIIHALTNVKINAVRIGDGVVTELHLTNGAKLTGAMVVQIEKESA